MARKGISIDEDVHSRGTDLKADDESWSEFLERAFDAVEADESPEPEDGEVTAARLDDVLTEDHIADIGADVERRVERVLDDRLTRR